MDIERTLFMVGSAAGVVAEPARLNCLENIGGKDSGRRHPIPPEGLVIGRAPPADLVVDDRQVSRSHCRLTIRNGHVWVEDLGSTNGAFVDGVRIEARVRLPVGAILRVGGASFKHEWLTSDQFARAEALDRDLAKAFLYVQALLPPPLAEGPVRADWLYQPCDRLGGDAFGYGLLPDGKVYIYVLDVSGHGAAAALHSVAVMNVLNQAALPRAAMDRPDEVLAALNAMFPMTRHAEMYFSIWYGVYDPETRWLDFASGGHHAGFLRPAGEGEPQPLRTRNVIIGARGPEASFRTDRIRLTPGDALYLFSDGLFEIVTIDGVEWDLSAFLPLLSAPPVDGQSEPARLFGAVRALARPGELEDDVTALVMTFP